MGSNLIVLGIDGYAGSGKILDAIMSAAGELEDSLSEDTRPLLDDNLDFTKTQSQVDGPTVDETRVGVYRHFIDELVKRTPYMLGTPPINPPEATASS